MNAETQPFRHLPHLEGKITDPAISRFRDFDYGPLDRQLAEAGIADWRRTDDEREATRHAALCNRLDDDLWVFAYGSLMWDPAFYFAEVRSALAPGYHRSFCLKSEIGRGSQGRPGLMAALDKGGECHGLVFRIAQSAVDRETHIIWRREMIAHAYAPLFIALETPQGPVEALAFVMDQTAEHYEPELALEERARLIATGKGLFGTSLEYLDNLAEHSVQEAIADLHKPLLLFHSPMDNTVGLEHARRIFETARHPKSFMSLDKADHLLRDNEHDAQFVATVLSTWAKRYVGAAANENAV